MLTENQTKIFNIVKDHLLKQGVRSMLPMGDDCAYRGKDGLKCAVGALIKDEHYHEGLEGAAAVSPMVQVAVEKSLDLKLTAGDANMLMALQWIHDSVDLSDWTNRLALFPNRTF